jgi:hypothetical protein
MYLQSLERQYGSIFLRGNIYGSVIVKVDFTTKTNLRE